MYTVQQCYGRVSACASTIGTTCPLTVPLTMTITSALCSVLFRLEGCAYLTGHANVELKPRLLAQCITFCGSEGVGECANQKNLVLNRTKSVETLISDKYRKNHFTSPPTVSCIDRVQTIKILGVTFSIKLSMYDHVHNTVKGCAPILYTTTRRFVPSLTSTSHCGSSVSRNVDRHVGSTASVVSPNG